MDKIVTALEVQKRNPDRINVYLDGNFAFGISRFVGTWLEVGQRIDELKTKTLLSADEKERALQSALHFIGFQPRTENEVFKKLEKLEFPIAIIDQVMDELREKRYVDDKEFATQWIESRSESKPRSKRFIEIELRKKGIASEIIETVLENAPDDYKSAIRLGKKYLRKFAILNDEEFQKKIYGVLARRAYSYSIIKDTVSELLKIRDEKLINEE